MHVPLQATLIDKGMRVGLKHQDVLKHILSNCKRDEETGCLIWAGDTSCNQPRINAPNLSKPGGPMETQVGRRAVWQLSKNKPTPPNKMAGRRAGLSRTVLSPEDIISVCTSNLSGKAEAARLGVSEQTISKARRGKLNCFTPIGGIFSGLVMA